MKLYGVLDLAFAGLYAWIGFVVCPSRAMWFNVLLATVIGLLALAGVGLTAGQAWGRTVAYVASALLAGFAALVVILLVASMSYLKAVYGALGEGMSVLAWVAIALVIEVFALLPLFQLRALQSHQSLRSRAP